MKKINIETINNYIDLNYSFDIDNQIENIFSLKLDSSCKIQGKITKKDINNINIKINIKQDFVFACYKCLDLVKFHLLHNVEEDINSESEFIENNIFDIEEYINQEIFLNVPSRVVCSENCKGLCPICGKNRNKEKCCCKQDKIKEDSPFKNLEELIKED